MNTDYIKFLVVYIVIDMIWIIGANKWHTNNVKSVQKSPLDINLTAAGLYYLLAPLSYVFIIKPLSKNKKEIVKNAMLVGLLMYGTFDLTNKALFKNYSWKYTFADMLWGMTSMTATSVIVNSF